MTIQHEVTIDLSRPQRVVIPVTQEDSTRRVLLSLLNRGSSYNMSSGLASGEELLTMVEFRRSDGTTGMYDTTSGGDTAVTQYGVASYGKWVVLLDGTCFTVPGWAQINVRFMTESGKLLHSFPITVDVHDTACPDESGGDPTQIESIADMKAAISELFNASMSEEAKQALLNLLAHVAYTDEHGQDYLDDLEAELFRTADLVSISAVFEQGSAVIYDTDDLDTFRQYLTVTATYEDLSTREITGYTLSGTLTAGTSTITVSYGGKTTTFDVAVTHNIVPSTYQRVEWIANTNRAYITTSIHFPTAFKVYLKTKLNDYLTYAAYGTVVGVRIAVDSSTFGANWIYVSATNAISSFMGSSSKIENISGIQNVLEWGSICDGTKNKLYIKQNGETTYSTEEGVTRDYTTVPIGIFLSAYSGMPSDVETFFVGAIYAFTIYDSNNNVYADFVPVYRKSDGVIGLYETESETFFTNTGSGTLTKGADV